MKTIMKITQSFFSELDKIGKKKDGQEKLVTRMRMNRTYNPPMKAGCGKNYAKDLVKRLTRAKIT